MRKKFKKLTLKRFTPVLLIGLLISIGIVAAYTVKKRAMPSELKPFDSEERSIPESLFKRLLEKGEEIPTPTLKPELTPTSTSKPKPPQETSTPVLTSTPSLVPTSTPTNTPTPTPTPRPPNPPIINISYPLEMQYIEMGSGQTLCVVDTPVGGDTSGVQRKHNVNDGGWSGYTDMFTLCFDPIEGLNRFHLQYKNSYGDESTVYTRQFNFHRI
jgi:hypothetical protein